MALTENELMERDAKRNLGERVQSGSGHLSHRLTRSKSPTA